ncbi:MAG: hypothetical protein HY711_03945 [Candidatus Melainabacteria bacterium]|nr:hypothetical protein [Candidatus Melainabacteria bacterium]
MFSIGVNCNMYPLYLETLKLKTLDILEGILLGNKQISSRSNSSSNAAQDATILARRVNNHSYEVIAPFAGKFVVEAHIFERLHKPIEPTKTRSTLGSGSQIEKHIYQKYIAKD